MTSAFILLWKVCLNEIFKQTVIKQRHRDAPAEKDKSPSSESGRRVSVVITGNWRAFSRSLFDRAGQARGGAPVSGHDTLVPVDRENTEKTVRHR